MVKPPPDAPAQPPSAMKGDAARERRLAEALRANLRRRKTATRSAKPVSLAETDR